MHTGQSDFMVPARHLCASSACVRQCGARSPARRRHPTCGCSSSRARSTSSTCHSGSTCLGPRRGRCRSSARGRRTDPRPAHAHTHTHRHTHTHTYTDTQRHRDTRTHTQKTDTHSRHRHRHTQKQTHTHARAPNVPHIAVENILRRLIVIQPADETKVGTKHGPTPRTRLPPLPPPGNPPPPFCKVCAPRA